MNNRPSSLRVFGSSLVADPYSPQFKPYVFGGDRTPAPEPAERICASDGCAGKHYAKGFCSKHYCAYKKQRKQAAA